ncbi:hypothetical protein A6R68_23283 [Neotoma lepida]|uniref:Uncharacterized protein n=1 Tax=Neotoma lepida TaxID=56216 RepID=A0A1A6HWV8_NEOLE|nr:hypothetical protein A6R68_23283 [Neotoma lepida]
MALINRGGVWTKWRKGTLGCGWAKGPGRQVAWKFYHQPQNTGLPGVVTIKEVEGKARGKKK